MPLFKTEEKYCIQIRFRLQRVGGNLVAKGIFLQILSPVPVNVVIFLLMLERSLGLRVGM